MSVFTCLKTECGFRTSGVVKDVKSNRRWCPKCNSPLVQCNHCNRYVSATVRGEEVICDNCGKPVHTDYVELVKEWHGRILARDKVLAEEIATLRCLATIDAEVYND